MGDSIGCDSNQTTRELERLRTDLERLRADLRTLSGDVRGAVRSGAEYARDVAKEQADDALRKLRKSKEFVETSVAEHPLISISLALAAGVAAGALLTRKDSSCD
ncbi:MAG: hypothetical protein ACK54H_02005 [Phycisphaerales bacterium]